MEIVEFMSQNYLTVNSSVTNQESLTLFSPRRAMSYAAEEPCQPLGGDFESWFDQLDGFSPRFGLDAIRKRRPKQETPPYPEHYAPSEDGSQERDVERENHDKTNEYSHEDDVSNFAERNGYSSNLRSREQDISVNSSAQKSSYHRDNAESDNVSQILHDKNESVFLSPHSGKQESSSRRLGLHALHSSPRKTLPPYPENYNPSDTDSTSLTPRSKTGSVDTTVHNDSAQRRLPKINILEKIQQFERNAHPAEVSEERKKDYKNKLSPSQNKNKENPPIVHNENLNRNITEHISKAQNIEVSQHTSSLAKSEKKKFQNCDVNYTKPACLNDDNISEIRQPKAKASKKYLESLTTGSELDDELSYFENCDDSIFQYALSDSSTECDMQSQHDPEIFADHVDGNVSIVEPNFPREIKNDADVLEVQFEKALSDVTSECRTDLGQSDGDETVVESNNSDVLKEYIAETQFDDYEPVDLDNLSELENRSLSNDHENSEIKLEYDERLFETDTSIDSHGNSHSDEFYSCYGDGINSIHSNHDSIRCDNENSRSSHSNGNNDTSMLNESGDCTTLEEDLISDPGMRQKGDETFQRLEREEIIDHKRTKSDSAIKFFKPDDVEPWADDDDSLTATEARVLNVLKTSRLFIQSGNRKDPEKRRDFWRNYKYNRRRNRKFQSFSAHNKVDGEAQSLSKTQTPILAPSVMNQSQTSSVKDRQRVGLKVKSSIKVEKDAEYLSLSFMEIALRKSNSAQIPKVSVKNRVKEWNKGHLEDEDARLDVSVEPHDSSEPPSHIQVFDLKEDSHDEESEFEKQPDWSIGDYQNKLQEMIVIRQVTEAEVDKLKEKLEEQTKAVEDLKAEQEVIKQQLHESREQAAILEKKYTKAKRLIKEFQNRETEFIERDQNLRKQITVIEKEHEEDKQCLHTQITELENQIDRMRLESGKNQNNSNVTNVEPRKFFSPLTETDSKSASPAVAQQGVRTNSRTTFDDLIASLDDMLEPNQTSTIDRPHEVLYSSIV